jgi:hypothetical protein
VVDACSARQAPADWQALDAVDQKDQGLGLGKHLLRDAIARCVQVADIIGVRAMLVHALHDDARRFYTYFDFQPSPTDQLHLLLPIQDARSLPDEGVIEPSQRRPRARPRLPDPRAGSRYGAQL